MSLLNDVKTKPDRDVKSSAPSAEDGFFSWRCSVHDHVRAQSPEQNVRHRIESTLARRVILLTVIFLLCLWSFVGFWALSTREEIVESTNHVLDRMTVAVEEQTRNQFRVVQVVLLTIDRWMTEHPDMDAGRDNFLGDLVHEFHKETGVFIDIYRVDAKGNVYDINSNESSGGVLANVFDREYFQVKTGNNIYVSLPVKSRINGEWVIPIALSLTSQREEARMVYATLRVSGLVDLYEQQRIKPNGSVAIFRNDGFLLARTPFQDDLLSRSYAQGRLFSELLPLKERGVFYFSSVATDATPRLVSYSRLKDFPLVVVVTASHQDILDAWRRYTVIVVLIMIVVSLSIIFAGIHLSRLLGRQAVLNAEVSRFAMVDYLTGAFNRRRFTEVLAREFARARRYYEPLALLMFDLDHFKRINDTHGHEAGDQVLIVFSEIVTANLRSVDYLGRFGGEEFVVLLPNTPLESAKLLAERICKAVNHAAVKLPAGDVHFSTSIGIASLDPGDSTPDDMLHRADEALYAAKNGGRNQVVSWSKASCDASNKEEIA